MSTRHNPQASTAAEIIKIDHRQQSEFVCSACGAGRDCDCNAPALERLAEMREQHRQRNKAYRERQKAEQDQSSRDVTRDVEVEDEPTPDPNHGDADRQDRDDDAAAWVAPPEVIRKNFIDTIDGHQAVVKAYRKIIKVAALNPAQKDEVRTAIRRLISKWQSLERALDGPAEKRAGLDDRDRHAPQSSTDKSGAP
jgi:hypothetical protein